MKESEMTARDIFVSAVLKTRDALGVRDKWWPMTGNQNAANKKATSLGRAFLEEVCWNLVGDDDDEGILAVSGDLASNRYSRCQRVEGILWDYSLWSADLSRLRFAGESEMHYDGVGNGTQSARGDHNGIVVDFAKLIHCSAPVRAFVCRAGMRAGEGSLSELGNRLAGMTVAASPGKLVVAILPTNSYRWKATRMATLQLPWVGTEVKWDDDLPSDFV